MSAEAELPLQQEETPRTLAMSASIRGKRRQVEACARQEMQNLDISNPVISTTPPTAPDGPAQGDPRAPRVPLHMTMQTRGYWRRDQPEAGPCVGGKPRGNKLPEGCLRRLFL